MILTRLFITIGAASLWVMSLSAAEMDHGGHAGMGHDMTKPQAGTMTQPGMEHQGHNMDAAKQQHHHEMSVPMEQHDMSTHQVDDKEAGKAPGHHDMSKTEAPQDMSNHQGHGMDHSMHAPAAPSTPRKPLSSLSSIPASGKSREAGFDKRYAMESTTELNNLATQCAQASRGLIMLDNASWKKCGSKTKGLATSATQPTTGQPPAMHHH